MRSLRRKRRAYGLAALLALSIGGAVAVSSAEADETAPTSPVTINRGETYVINGGSPSSEPEVHAIDNSHALVVHVQPDGQVLVLGAEAGTETVRVTKADGRIETYEFTVRALSDPNGPLAPGANPSADTQALDRGAGPLDAGDTKTIVEPAPAPIAAPVAPASPPQGSSSASAAVDHDDQGQTGSASPAGSPASLPLTLRQGATQKFTANPQAAEPEVEESGGSAGSLPDDTISMRFGSSRIFNLPRRIKRVSIADSEIADVQVVDPHQLMLIGRKPGFTTLAVWDSQGLYQERQVRIEQSGQQQVMLNVMVAELDRSRLENQGVDYAAALSHLGVSLTGLPASVATSYSAASVINGVGTSGSGLLPAGGSIIPLLLSNGVTYALAAQNSAVQTQTFFRFLEENSLARVLAQPQLLANSGEQAKFLSGGEMPIVIAQALNTSIVFKQFGTSVVFVPTVIGKHQIELLVKPEVSKPDFTQGVSLFGFTVPAFITQRAETMVRMDDNQTLIIAGLILRDRRAVVRKVPYLGDIPFAGALFRGTSYQDQKSELVMSVTPQIVRPIPAGAEAAVPASGPLTSDELRTERVNPPDASRPRF
jgi:Flp pilus assembly secretin CpaC